MDRGDLRALLLFLFLLSSSCRILSAAAGQSNGVCISPGGRFPAFSSEGKPPNKAGKGSRDLALCRIFRQNTCCDVAQTYPALLQIRRLGSIGEGSQECLHLWELLECSICDPRLGTQPGPPLICPSFCDMVFQACSNAYFSIDAKTRVLSSCGLSDIVCGRASEWASNGTELCQLAGFSVQPVRPSSHDIDEPFCYGGKASLESISDSWTSPKSKSSVNALKSWMVEDFRQWARETSLSERISWAVGGMVLTAGLILISKRKSYSHTRKQAAIQSTTKRVQASQRSSAIIRYRQ